MCGSDHAGLKAKREAIYLSNNDDLPEFLTGMEYLELLFKLYS